MVTLLSLTTHTRPGVLVDPSSYTEAKPFVVRQPLRPGCGELAVAHHLDAIVQRGRGAMDPAGPTSVENTKKIDY